ncbi:MAG TPA: hypothetical protein PK121_01960 [Candidatus Pacearchaeota archaeon]|nr:hypothetical protein [Candidatus Pacearchaeota archaeon]
MDWYQFFNNSTVAVIVGVSIGTIIAVWQYKKQKSIDFIEKQKNNLIDLLASLDFKIEETYFILERLAYTYKLIGEKFSEKENLSSFKDEIFKISNLINEDIPLLDKKINLFLNLYFREKESLKNFYDDYQEKLKNWQNFIFANYKFWLKFIMDNQKVPPQLETKNISESINKLIEKIKNV